METPFTPLAPVAAIHTPLLSAEESAKLLAAINGVRLGLFQYTVAITYKKIGKGKPRIAGKTYKPLPGVTPNFHEGVLFAAPTNKKGAVYLSILDAARAKVEPEEGETTEAWFTNVSLAGITSFRLLPNGVAPGPVAKAIAAQAQALAVAQAAARAQSGQ